MKKYLFIFFTICFLSVNYSAQKPPPPAPSTQQISKPAPPPPPPPPPVYNAPDKSSIKEFSSEKYGFIADFPGQPEISESNIDDAFTTIFKAKLKGSNEIIEISDFDFDVEKNLGKTDVFEQVKQKYLSGETSELLFEREIEQNGLQGMEFGLKILGEFYRARVFVKNGRIYELIASVTNWSVYVNDKNEKAKEFRAEADRFFNSFKIKKFPTDIFPDSSKTEKIELFKSKKNIFESNEGGFKVYFPRNPEIKTSQIPAAFGQADFFAYTVPTLSAYYAVTYFDYPAVITDQTEIRFISDYQRDGLMSKGHALVSEKDISYKGNYGREYVLTFEGNTLVMRNFFVNQRFFRLLVFTRGIKDKIPETFINQNRNLTYRFLDSFEPTKIPPPKFAEIKMPEDFAARIENSVFYSDFFGFSMKIPESWETFNKEESAALKVIGLQYLENKNETIDLNMEKSFENTEFLFAMAKGGNEQDEKLKVLIVAAEKMSIPSFLPEAAVEAHIKNFLDENEEVVGGINKTKFDGVDFAYVETLDKKEKSRHRIYFANIKNLAFEITFSFYTDADLKEILEALNTIKFKK